MPSPRRDRPGRPHLDRDSQQWMFDYLIKETGKVYHWWNDGGEKLPSSVRSHAMISKHLGKKAQRLEALAGVELAAGHERTALGIFYRAAREYMRAQHPIFETNDEKRFLYAGLRRAFAKVQQLCPYVIERVDVKWEPEQLGGFLHLHPQLERAPLIFYLPGCDATCETWPDPLANAGHERGFHVFSFDGPGQGASNIAGIPLTGDNYESAASRVLDALVARPEIDADQVVVYGGGMGGYWALSWAAREPRLRAAATKSTYTDKYYLMNEESPRWKQLFAYMTRSESERDLDELMASMNLSGRLASISCPVLMLTGEYDLRDPVPEVFELFDELVAPAELWVFADQFHKLSLGGGDTVASLMLDWLRDRVDGRPQANAGDTLYLEQSGTGPDAPDVRIGRNWFDAT